MRITNSMMAQNLLLNIENTQTSMFDTQNQLSTGYKINQPSDDPVGTGNVMQLKNTLSTVGQWQKNASSALGVMNTTSSSLSSIISMVQRIRELAVQGTNDTLSASDRTALASQVDQITHQIQFTANTQSGDRYIFGGSNASQPPYVSGQTWAGNTDPVNFQLGNNYSVDTSVNGNQVFNTPTTGGEGLLSGSSTGTGGILADLSSALKNNNPSAISDTLSTLDSNIDNLTAINADLGARINSVTSLQQQLTTSSTNLQQSISSLQDTDMAQTISNFTQIQNTYNAALAVGAKIIQPSLVNFLT